MGKMESVVIETPIEKAVRLAGGQTSLAKKIGVTQGAVWKWLRGIQRVSAENAVSISEVIDGQVMPYDLRPDLKKVFPRPCDTDQEAKS